MAPPAPAGRPLTVLAPTRYPWRFNSPRRSRHTIVRRNFVPFNYLSPKIEGFTLFPPSLTARPDLIHAFNRIPVSRLPYVIGFESHLPRGFGIEDTRLFRAMTRALAGERCRRIVAISRFAERIFLRQHEGRPELEALRDKLQVRFPSFPIPPAVPDDERPPPEPLRLLFVGNHFGRKGGFVALRMAELALHRGLPIAVDLVSSFEPSWTDPTDPAYSEGFRRLVDLPNVISHGPQPNDRVLDLMASAHLVLLPTFGDTFGYSAIEAMANSTPVLATRQGALPEFIEDGVSGLLVDLPVNDLGEWSGLDGQDRGSERFARAHREEVERLAEAGLARATALLGRPDEIARLQHGAYTAARRHFAAEDANVFWDDLYEEALAPRTARVPVSA